MRPFTTVISFVLVGILAFAQMNTDFQKSRGDTEPKALRHVCGIIADPSGALIPNVTVKVRRGGAEVASTQSGQSGDFSFQKLQAGEYELQAQASGFQSVRFAFSVARPTTRCKLPLRIKLPVGQSWSGEIINQQPPQPTTGAESAPVK